MDKSIENDYRDSTTIIAQYGRSSLWIGNRCRKCRYRARNRRFFEDREDEEEEWQTAAVELATATQANYEFYLESSKIQQRETLQRHLERLGKQAQELAVIGQQRGYDDTDVETVEDLAETCGAYSSGALLNNGSLENELQHNLENVVPAVFELVE